MDWIQNRDTWQSGPYVIELAGPRQWVLTLAHPDDSPASFVRSEGEWRARSLSEMKKMAEAMEQRKGEVRSTQRYLALLVGSALAFGVAAGGSGRLSAVAAIATAGVAIFALARVVDRWRHRPWDHLRHVSQ